MNTSSPVRLLRPLFAALALAVLAGCQHAPTYRASNGDGEPGYSSWQESGTVFFVRYVGEPGAKLTEVRDLALLRAADIAHAAGRSEFVVLEEHQRQKSEIVRHNTAPPASPFVNSDAAGGETPTQREVAARSRPLINNSVPARVEMQTVELKISTQADAAHPAMDSSAPYVVETLRRDIPAKYRLPAAARS